MEHALGGATPATPACLGLAQAQRCVYTPVLYLLRLFWIRLGLPSATTRWNPPHGVHHLVFGRWRLCEASLECLCHSCAATARPLAGGPGLTRLESIEEGHCEFFVLGARHNDLNSRK